MAKSTLHARMNGGMNRLDVQLPQHRLTPDQENFLADWVIEQDAQGFSPSHPRVREMAFRILQMNGNCSPLGKKWITGFIRRNPRVATCIGKKIDNKRVKSSQPEADSQRLGGDSLRGKRVS